MTPDGIREQLARGLLGVGYAGLTPVQRSVVDLMAAESPTGHGPALVEDRDFWERLADRVAQVGGSWTFLGAFALAMTAWVAANLLLARWAFDPYPFIFLNLVLSTVAAVQAPVILMSQNRQAMLDRRDQANDYDVNLKAELEIELLHHKIDLLRTKEIQLLTELVKDLSQKLAARDAPGG